MVSKNNIFIEKARQIHNDKYDYSKVNYVNSRTKVCIICPTHGEFWQTPHNHLKGYGCAECGKEKSHLSKMTTEDFIVKSKEIHGNKYDYSKACYKTCDTKVCIICPEHGEFWQTPSNHINGRGCPKCANEKRKNALLKDTKLFIDAATLIHNGKPEDEIISLFSKIEHQQHNREILNGMEIDIFIPPLKLGIEYNGLRWHSEEFGKDHRYHLDKLNKCNEQGIKLIQIFEDEWINHRDICESKLKQICGLNTNPKIYGRKCEIREITNKDIAYKFLDKNHIQGRTSFTIALGAYHQEELVGVMTFKNEKEGYWDLNRFATDINYQCVGIGGKLFKYFTRNYDFQEIKSFADRRWTTGPTNNLYTKLGFEFDSYVPPTYWYYNSKINPYTRFHKFGFRKQHLHKQYGLPLTMTEREMTTTLGYVRIWDCGLVKYIYKLNSPYTK